jgi:glutamate/tyrosine decarboxylase-like PLP-dependent enzyme
MKKKLERTESEMMNYEYERMRNALMNQELREQLEEKDEVIAKQQCKLVCMAIDLAKKESECEQLHNTLYEQQSVMRYIEEQAREMREMLHIGEECFDKGRMTVEELD